MTRARFIDDYKYATKKRQRYCVLSAAQKYKLSQAIDRDLKAGLKTKHIRENIEAQYKLMEGNVRIFRNPLLRFVRIFGLKNRDFRFLSEYSAVRILRDPL